MSNVFGSTAVVLTVLLALATVADGVFGPARFARWLRKSGEPGARNRFYRRVMAVQWVTAAVVVLVLWTSPDLPAADLGLTWPRGGGLDYAMSAFALLMLAIGCLRARRAMRKGIDIPGRIPGMIPQSAAERVGAIGVSVSAGICEELVFRGLFIAAGLHLLGLPLAVAAGGSLLLFAWAHRYQGIRGVIGSGVIGLLLTLLYVLSGSLLLPIIVHIAQDLMVLLLIPAEPARDVTPEPALADPAAGLLTDSASLASVRPAADTSLPTLRPAVAPGEDGPN